MKKEIKNLPASIHTRLKRRAVETQHSFQELFYFYAFEGFLHRLSLSQYGSRLILKGGLAFRKFFLPPMQAAANGEDFDRNWTAQAGWLG